MMLWIDSLKDVFLDQLQDVYSAERQLVSALPKIAKAAESSELRNAFEDHLQQTRTHVNRLEQAFQLLGQKAKENTCEGMQGLIEEGEEMISQWGNAEARDAGLIGAAQKVEHYEIASYGTLCTWAEQLGKPDVARLLHLTLDEEKQTDSKLSRLAEQMINQQAAHA